MTKLDEAKKCAKNHGVKGFRKMKLKRPIHLIGKQCQHINPHVALRLIDRLKEIGFRIGDEQVTRELAVKGLLDTISIEGV
jgi:hypothetical protein